MSNQKLTPMVGDVWGIERPHLTATYKIKDPKEFCNHGYQLIERNGLRGERLWETFTYQDCPQYRHDELKQAWEDGRDIEYSHPISHLEWRLVSSSDDLQQDHRHYRIAEKREVDILMTSYNPMAQECVPFSCAPVADQPVEADLSKENSR